MNPDLSVIVTCYNLQNYLPACLNSLAETDFPSNRLEVLVINDGSTDASQQIIDRYTQQYPNFYSVYELNQGVSVARNHGIQLARGKYIAFVDGDDIVPKNAYSRLMYTAERNHSDVVAGFVHRFDNLRNRGSYLHKFAIKDDYPHTDLKHNPDLLYDTTTWNKVYQKSFLIKHQLYFIPHIIYEDLPFTLNVYLHTRRVSTIKDTVYYWRWRPNSITQNRNQCLNFRMRLHAINICKRLLLSKGYNGLSSLFHEFEAKVLKVDIPIYLENIGNSEYHNQYRTEELAYSFLKNWGLLHSPLVSRLPIKTQVLYYAIQTSDLGLLKKFTYTKRLGKFSYNPFTRKYRFKTAELPPAVASRINYRGTLRYLQHLNHVNLNPDSHIISGNGMLRFRKIHLHKHAFNNRDYAENLSASLVNIFNHRQMPIKFIRKRTPLYKRTLHPTGSWTNSRYQFAFNYQQAVKHIGYGYWMIKVQETVNRRYQIKLYLGKPIKVHRASFQTLSTRKYSLFSTYNTNRQLVFKAVSSKDLLSKTRLSMPAITDQHYLCFRTHLADGTASIQPYLRFTRQKHYIKGRLINQPRSHYQLISFDLSFWPQDLLNKYATVLLVDRKTNYRLEYVHPHQRNYQYLPVNHKYQVTVTYTAKRYLHALLNYRPALVTSYRLKNRYLMLNIRTPQVVNSRERFCMVAIARNLRHRYTFHNRCFTMADVHDLKFKIPLVTSNRKQINILKGKYVFRLYLIGNRSVCLNLRLRNDSFSMPARQPLKTALHDPLYYKISQNHKGHFQLRVYQPKPPMQKHRYYRSFCYSVLYPLMRFLPLRKIMVFDSYWGTQFSSNERAIYEYLQEHYPKLKTVWFFKNRLTPITGHGKRIRTNTLKYWYYLAVARYLIQNTNLPDQYLKRRGQIEVESLHGTFLKHMGYDEPYFKYGTRGRQKRFARRNRRWDYLIVPSDYMQKTASHAFDYHRRFIKSGFPRTDDLVKHDNAQYRKLIKKRLGIPEYKRVILYAPTYRKNDPYSFHLDLARLRQELPPQDVILIRLHYFVAHTHSFYNHPGFVYDVSDYPNINDLFVVSDALVTDYSSVMFDYAYLDRPMIFYAYDKDQYLDDRIRGTYLDYDRDMPGPIVTNQHDLAHAIINLDQIKSEYHDKLLEFHHRFAQYGNYGNATQQAVHQILNVKGDNDPHSLINEQKPDKYVIAHKLWHPFHIYNLQSRLLNWLGSILPKRNIIIFESFFGTQYSDNPKAIYLYIKKHYPDYQLYWNVKPECVPYFRAHHIPYIVRFSYRGILKQAQAKYWITNCRRPLRWKLPKGSILLQTWHGTPLKTIGEDVNKMTMPGNNVAKYHKQVYQDNSRWKYLIAPNRYSSRIMQQAFRMQPNQMMLTGYPRDDILRNATPEYVQHIKKHLGIPKGRKVVLYAPTWRDNEYIRSDKFTAKLHLDLAKMRAHYGNHIVVLVRTHYMIANHLDLSKYRGFAINVSDYPDIADLYLISDILITDYSSVMFDYAILRRPIIFYDYDLQQYAGHIRGFYFDIRRHAPGPITTTTEQVIKCLDSILNHGWRPNRAYRHFVQTFTPWMDGHATQRVVSELFNRNNTSAVRYNVKYISGLPKHPYLRDGALMWNHQHDFTNPKALKAQLNYSYSPNDRFRAIKGLQLYSSSFPNPLGSEYILLKWLNNHNQEFWVTKSDIR